MAWFLKRFLLLPDPQSAQKDHPWVGPLQCSTFSLALRSAADLCWTGIPRQHAALPKHWWTQRCETATRDDLFVYSEPRWECGSAARVADPWRPCPWWVKHRQPLRLRLSQAAAPPQTWQRQIAMLIYVNPCQEDMMHIMMPSAPPKSTLMSN